MGLGEDEEAWKMMGIEHMLKLGRDTGFNSLGLNSPILNIPWKGIQINAQEQCNWVGCQFKGI